MHTDGIWFLMHFVGMYTCNFVKFTGGIRACGCILIAMCFVRHLRVAIDIDRGLIPNLDVCRPWLGVATEQFR